MQRMRNISYISKINHSGQFRNVASCRIMFLSLPCRQRELHILQPSGTGAAARTSCSDLNSQSIHGENLFSRNTTHRLELLDVASLHSHLPGVPPGQQGGPARGAGGVDIVMVQYYPRPSEDNVLVCCDVVIKYFNSPTRNHVDSDNLNEKIFPFG